MIVGLGDMRPMTDREAIARLRAGRDLYEKWSALLHSQGGATRSWFDLDCAEQIAWVKIALEVTP